MAKKLVFIVLFISVSLGLYSQRPTLELTFTAVDSAADVQLDSIKIMNRTQGGETRIYWPDTSLSFDISPGDLLLYVGYATFTANDVPEVNNDISSFTVYQNYPNPLIDWSEIAIYIPHTGKVNIMITDLQGKVILRLDRQLDGGYHSFRFHPGGGTLYFLTAYWNGMSQSIQMISTGQQDSKDCKLDYVGYQPGETVLKNSLQTNDFIVRQSGILDSPEENTTYIFQFATNIPCPGTPTVEYEGQVYNTIQIFSQCWLKENLNIGTMIPGSQWQTNNGIIEKYCYENKPDSCIKYGGLYQWNEMMQSTYQQGAQGICPVGWHLPTDEEWKVLEGAVDSQYGIGSNTWDYPGYRGYDSGKNLKTISSWRNGGNGTDLFGFSGLPGGRKDPLGDSGGVCNWGFWWTSTSRDNENSWNRDLFYNMPNVERYYDDHAGVGLSVRCLKDN